MSNTASMYTIASAIVAAETAFLGPNRNWKTSNELQQKFVSTILEVVRPELFRIPEIESMAALSEVPINKFLKERGFDIQLDPFPRVSPPARAWGAASVLDVTVQWKIKGTIGEIETANKATYPAAVLGDDATQVFQVGHTPVARLATQSSDIAYMAVHENPVGRFELLAAVEELMRAPRSSARYKGLIFPMVDLDHKVDIGWLKELETTDQEGYLNIIVQALQQTKLKINHIGARIKDAVAIGGVRFAAFEEKMPPLVIDRPFLFWIERPGLSRPLFASYITQEHWKDPGSLQDM